LRRWQDISNQAKTEFFSSDSVTTLIARRLELGAVLDV
jgi:hypothetical protein